MSYYGNVYNVPYGYQQPYGYNGSFISPQTTAQQMMQQQQMQQMQQPMVQQQMMQQPVVQQPVVQQQTPNTTGFSGVIVNSFEDVKEYPVPLGGLTLLLNKKDKKFYIKSLNENGIPVIETYTFESLGDNTINEQEQQSNANIDNLIKRVDTIEKKLKIE